MITLKEILEYPLITISKNPLTPIHILAALLIIFIARIFLWGVRKFLSRQSTQNKLGEGQEYALYQIIKYFVFVIAFVLILDSIGLNITILFAYVLSQAVNESPASKGKSFKFLIFLPERG